MNWNSEKEAAPAGASTPSSQDGASSDDLDRDGQELAKMGKKQQTRRNFGFWSIMGLAATINITWEALFIAIIYGLQNGGPAGLIYGFLFCWLGTFALVLSLSELVSLAPTAGGQYHWIYLLAPKSSRKFLSFVAGWQSVLAWQATVASASYLAGKGIQGLLVLNYPTYEYQLWHGTMLMYAVLVISVVFNTLLGSQLPKVEGAVLAIHILGFFVFLIPLVYLAPHPRASAHDVFAQFTSSAGYSSVGLSFFVGLLTPVFGFIGVDGAVHMCEEIKDASTNIPKSLIGAIAINGTLGFAALIAILFCIGDVDMALESPTGFPLMEILARAMGVKAAIAESTMVLIIFIFATVSCFTAASRMTWAFARDEGLPGSRFISRIEKGSKLPLISMLLTALISLILGLIRIGSDEAFAAVISLAVAGFLGSYLLPIGMIFVKRLTNDNIHYGPWRLGKWGVLVNGFTLVWGVIVMFFSFWPAELPAVAETMNWSCLMYGGTTVFSIVYYFVRGRHHYDGPVIETSVVERLHEA